MAVRNKKTLIIVVILMLKLKREIKKIYMYWVEG